MDKILAEAWKYPINNNEPFGEDSTNESNNSNTQTLAGEEGAFCDTHNKSGDCVWIDDDADDADSDINVYSSLIKLNKLEQTVNLSYKELIKEYRKLIDRLWEEKEFYKTHYGKHFKLNGGYIQV